MKSSFPLFLLLQRFISHTLAAPTCTQTLADADKDTSGGLSLSEYRSFLEQEAAKNDFVIMVTTNTDLESPIGHLFTMLAGGAAPVAGEIDIAGASATDLSLIPARQQAILELICVKSKALIHEIASYAPADMQQAGLILNNPFLGENSQRQQTHVETRQQAGQDEPMAPLPFGMKLDIFGTNPMNFPYCRYPWGSFVSCISESCSNFLQSCQDTSASPGADFSLVIGNSMPNTCSEFGAAVCDAFADLPESCCLSQCFYEVYNLAHCTVEASKPTEIPKPECFPYPDCFVDFMFDMEGGEGLNETTSIDVLQGFYFDFFGTFMKEEEIMTAECMEPADNTLVCMEKDCPNFLGSCFTEFVSFPWSFGPEADNFFFNPQSFPPPAQAYFSVNNQSVDLTPAYFGCSNMTNAFCELFNFPDTCCLSKCMNQLYDLAACMADYAIGDSSNLAAACPTPLCAKPNDSSNNSMLDNSTVPSNHTMLDSILVSVNSSFLISTLEDITAAVLKDDLLGENSKYVKVLQEAYLYLVWMVADVMAGGSERRHLFVSSDIVSNTGIGLETYARSRRMQEASHKLDRSSVEVYNFVDSPCDDTAIEAVSKQGESTKTCISVFGKYSILVDPQEDPMKVYNQFMAATTSSISSGMLQESLLSAADLLNVTAKFPFVIEGVSSEYDNSFVSSHANVTGLGKNVTVPLSTDLVATDDSGVTPSLANGTLEPDADVSTVSPTNGSLIVLTMAPSSSCQGKSMLMLSCMCFWVIFTVLSGI